MLGFEICAQEATSAEINTYLEAVDGASDEVSTGSHATSAEGRDMRYAVVGEPGAVAQARRTQVETDGKLERVVSRLDEADVVSARVP